VTTMTETFVCCHCNKEKDVYFLFRAAHGQTLCLWCAEDYGLIRPRGRKRY
jgi:hypothetical protein